MKLGYARVSTEDQTLDLQRPRLLAVGCEKLFEEKISGAKRNRPELEKLLGEVRKEDILVVTRLDRLARSTVELLAIAERLREKDTGLQSLDEPWVDTESPAKSRRYLSQKATAKLKTFAGAFATDAGSRHEARLRPRLHRGPDPRSPAASPLGRRL